MTDRWHHFLDAQISRRPEALALTDSGAASWTYAALEAARDAVGDALRGAGV